MEAYIIDSNTEKKYRDIIFQQDGRGPEIDRYIYNTQDGSGIGSFFGKLFSMALPLFKSMGKKVIIPAAKKAGQAAINRGAEYALEKLSDSVIRKPSKKRTPSTSTNRRRTKRRRYV